MKKTLLLLLWQFCLLPVATYAFADTVTLKDCGVMQGRIESGSSGQIRIDVGGEMRTISVELIESVQFDAPAAAVAAPAPAALSVRAPEPAPPRPRERGLHPHPR